MTEQNAMIADLARSGLVPSDIDAREAGSLEFSALGLVGTGHEGYVLPYFDLHGKPRSFYRVKLFTGDVKYRQPKQTSNSIYFPPGFAGLLAKEKYVVIVEGEKKAACGVKHGIPTVALGGVDSYKNRNILLPEQVEFSKALGKGQVAKLPAGTEGLMEGISTYASGLKELTDLCHSRGYAVVICHDTDSELGVKYEVQRAAASLGFELRHMGVKFAKIKQYILPWNGKKAGFDDHIMTVGGATVKADIEATLKKDHNFPRHPNTADYVNKKLARTKLTRQEANQAGIALLADMDSHGQRLLAADAKQMYYFDMDTRTLMRVSLNEGAKGLVHETDFGKFLYRNYNIAAGVDGRVMSWLDVAFHAEEPIKPVSPHRVIARPGPGEDCVRLQLGDGNYVAVDGSGEETEIRIHDNGDDGVLFESGQVEEVDTAKLMEQVEFQRAQEPHAWWMDVLNTVRLKDDSRRQRVIAYLYYISPWLYKWRNTQLPVELVIGEPGSGKSSLCEHRLNIITGSPRLRNAPGDLKDWHASITNAGGLHVVDNVNLTDKNFRQKLSDEMCRLVTEPDPQIEMRRLYSNNELVQIPARVVFGLTAVSQPFMQADLLQRSMIIELNKFASAQGGEIKYEYNWVSDQMERFGGREAWIAHHLVILERFFDMVREHWNSRYLAAHRLINVEQALILVANIFGDDGQWIPAYLTESARSTITDSDWALEGLAAWARMWHQQNGDEKPFSTHDVVNWALASPEFEECSQINSVRRLGRYLDSSQQMISEMTGIIKAHENPTGKFYRVAQRR